MKNKQTEFLKLCLADALIKLMKTKNYEDISINSICELAGVGRTTFYRHLDYKTCKEDLIHFKIEYEWKKYIEDYEGDIEKDKGGLILRYIYENKKLFLLIYKQGLISLIMDICTNLMTSNEQVSKDLSYIMSFFTHGYFGIIHQWIKYEFDETPEDIEKHILNSMNMNHQ